ncbi:MAG: hypothetical protein CVT66_10820 [Actinobacteria bacterium HGW-Actinobacteria-6]|jgi:hypothetical protein|nr:MAG: hypothetical protein CVU63_01070 [Deltaproteobacteria bacterium HGW-Deltaproteobacteria-20]PKQ19312.1 MAG: hypothetical protein CVT66_10820 [Actinobacteria bacterium HGW-Actinobacteria-6]
MAKTHVGVRSALRAKKLRTRQGRVPAEGEMKAMKRSLFVALALVMSLAVPGVASAVVDAPTIQIKRDSESTYYSNVPGWNNSLEVHYYNNSSTVWRVTKISVYQALSSTTVYAPLYPFSFYNKSGTIGPVAVWIKSAGSNAYYNISSDVHSRTPGGSVSHTWYPNVNAQKYYTYGQANVTWTQQLNSVYNSALSSAKPCVLRTSTF